MNKAVHRSIPAIVNGRVGHTSIHIDVPGPSDRHLNDLINSKCFPDLLLTGYFPNAKELTESCAAYRASNRLRLDFNSSDVCCICVGDGVHPRTAAMFAFRTKWHCFSVDPKAQIAKPQPVVERCWQFAGDLKTFSPPRAFGTYVLVCVHSHCKKAELLRFISKLKGNVHVISIRCCEEDDLPKKPTAEYLDWGIWSPERRVRIWKDYNQKEHNHAPRG